MAQAFGISLSNCQERYTAQVSRPSKRDREGWGAMIQNTLSQAAGTVGGAYVKKGMIDISKRF